MESEKNELGINFIANNSDSDSDSDSTLTPWKGEQLYSLKKAYVAHAEGRRRYVIQTEEAFAEIDNSHIPFQGLLTAENQIDHEKIETFKRAYNLRQEACEQIIERTKSIHDQYSKKMLTDIDRANKKNLFRNIDKLNESLKEDRKLLGSQQKVINKLTRIEEALNSYSIIPIEPSHSVIYQIGVLYHVKEKGLLTPGEFLNVVSVRLEQLPDPFRWHEAEGKIIDLTTDVDALAYQINDYLEEQEESELYAIACKRFKKRVKGIEHENELKNQAMQSLKKLDAFDAPKVLENSLIPAGNSGEAQVSSEPQVKKIDSLFYPLLPEEMRELAKIVNIKGSVSLGYPMRSLIIDYQKTARQGKKRELTPSEHMKYALKIRDVANKSVHTIEDNLLNELSIHANVGELVSKTQRICEEYKKKTHECMPADVSGDAAEHFFSDYSEKLENKLANLRKVVKKHHSSEGAKARDEIEKYGFIKVSIEKLKKLVLEEKVAVTIGGDLSMCEYGASTQVLNQFEEQLDGKNIEAILKIKRDLQETKFLKKEYNSIEELHKTERCVSGGKWKPLTEALGPYLDRKIAFLANKNEQPPSTDKDGILAASIEADAQYCVASTSTFMDFYKPPREKKADEPFKTKLFKQGAIFAASLLD